MARGKKYSSEQIVELLRQIDVAVRNGKSRDEACNQAGIIAKTYYRWRREYAGLDALQAERLMELEEENAKLKRLVAELSLQKMVLRDLAARAL